MFGKLMSISDDLMWKYWLLLTDRGAEDIDAEKSRVADGSIHPMDVKKALATTIVTELLSKVLVEGELAASNSEARRLIQQGGVKVDGDAVRDVKVEISTTGADSFLLQVGKRRFAKVTFTRE